MNLIANPSSGDILETAECGVVDRMCTRLFKSTSIPLCGYELIVLII